VIRDTIRVKTTKMRIKRFRVLRYNKSDTKEVVGMNVNQEQMSIA